MTQSFEIYLINCSYQKSAFDIRVAKRQEISIDQVIAQLSEKYANKVHILDFYFEEIEKCAAIDHFFKGCEFLILELIGNIKLSAEVAKIDLADNIQAA